MSSNIYFTQIHYRWQRGFHKRLNELKTHIGTI